MNTSVRWALVSVSDKTDLVPLAGDLVNRFGFRLLSTGGTAKVLKEADIFVTEVADYTGFPEMLDGRVKTLHPMIYAGILARCDRKEHMEALDQANIIPIELVVCNLYPFSATVAKPGCTHEDAIENIDIGGPTMLRAAAKNYESVTVIVDPTDYASLVTANARGYIDRDMRYKLAQKAFAHTAAYDTAIADYLSGKVIVHGVRSALALCAFSDWPPINWSKGHRDVSYKEAKEITCPECQAIAIYLKRNGE